MRIIVQRVFQAWVRVEGVQISKIKQGVLVLVGLTPGDTQEVVEHMANKTLNMRLWENDGKSWSSSVIDVKGQVLAVSQFTLYGILKGNKPDFHGAMQADKARQMFDYFIESLRKKYDHNKVQTGKFQHLMEVGSINNGPVTIQYEKFAQQKKGKQKIQDQEWKKTKQEQEKKKTHINEQNKKSQNKAEIIKQEISKGEIIIGNMKTQSLKQSSQKIVIEK